MQHRKKNEHRGNASADLGLEKHVSNVSATCLRHLRQLRHIRRSLSTVSATTLVHAFVASRVDYCNVGDLKSVTSKLQRVLNAAARVFSGTRTFDRGLAQLYQTPIFTGLSASSTNSARWCADARTALLHSIWHHTGHQSLRLRHDSIFVRVPAINWQFRHIGGSHTVVGRSLSSVRQRGTHCRNVYATLLTVLLFLAVFLKHFSSQSTNVYSALEALEWMLYINRSFTLYHITLSHGRSSPLINFSRQSTSSFLEMHFRSSLRQLSTHNKKNNAWSFINNKATHTHTRLTALFPGLPGWAVPEK